MKGDDHRYIKRVSIDRQKRAEDDKYGRWKKGIRYPTNKGKEESKDKHTWQTTL